MAIVKPLTQAEYEEFDEGYIGYCTNCGEFTGEECEPDAREYHCPECETNTVYGTDEALMMGYIALREASE